MAHRIGTPGLVLRTKKLTKFYGASLGIQDVDLSVFTGEVFGFLGPNGSGKTTTIRILLDLIRATSGSAQIFGMDAHADSSRVRSRIGYLPGEYGIYEDMTAVEYLRFLASLRGDKKPPLTQRLLGLLDLDPSRRIGSFSHGTKQKLALVQAFMHDPELAILDEPTSGLDPLVQQRFFDFLLESKERGRTIFLSSHILSEVERVCDRVAILKEGRLIALHGISDLKRLRLTTIEVTFQQDLDEQVLQLEGIRRIEKDGYTVRLWADANLNGILEVLSQYPIDTISCGGARLEDIFLEYYSE